MINNSTLSKKLKLSSITLCVLLTACGGGSSKNITPEPTPTVTPSAPEQGVISGPLNTGSVSAPQFVYYDLDSKTVVDITTEQAATNTVWDIAYRRSGVYLNQHSDNTVTAYATGNNSDFFDADGKAISASFISASAETELDDYLAIKTSDIPTDKNLFVGDLTSNIINNFFDYNVTTHKVNAADTKYFISNSDEAFTKFRVTHLTTVDKSIEEITFKTAYQGNSDTAFATEKELVIDATLTCSGNVTHVYIDFETNQEVTMADAWDINLPCATDKPGANFTINIADDSQAMHDFDNSYDAIDPAAIAYYGFQENSYSVKAFDSTPWYQYGLNGGHLLWSQFDIYIIKTSTKTHKLQLTSYYNADGSSGHISFRADEISELAGKVTH